MKRGFTLLELLIVIGILAILSTTMVLVINPAEIMKRARDSQRLSDLSTLQSALGYYLTNTNSPSIGVSTNAYGYNVGTGTCATKTIVSGTSRSIDGTGWIPISFASLAGGSPISSLPIDPSNTTGLHYWYLCDTSDYTFELLAHLESSQYQSKYTTDGGQLSDMYELGTKMIAATSTGCN